MTIRNIDDVVMQALRRRAAAAGHSMEEEARRALAMAVGVDRVRARARIDLARRALSGHRDREAEKLVREMRDERTGRLSE